MKLRVFKILKKTKVEGPETRYCIWTQGCSHHCTFCIVRFARGKNQGLPPEQAIEQAKTFVKNGFCEIVLRNNLL